jgi:hypothetical protein
MLKIPRWAQNIGGILVSLIAWATSGPVYPLLSPHVGAVLIAVGGLLQAFGFHAAIVRADASHAAVEQAMNDAAAAAENAANHAAVAAQASTAVASKIVPAAIPPKGVA